MKKLIISIISVCLLCLCIALPFMNKKDNNLKKIKVAEVTHSIFYAPQYLADALGYFEDEGIDVEFILTSGANNVTAAVLSGDVEIGFCGSEATIYVYNQGEEDYLINFAGLTKKDGSFLVAREKNDNFKVEDLKGKHIIAGRKGGMPAMTLEWALNQNGLKTEDVNFDTSIDFASTTGAFIGGIGDYVSVFEPTALQLEKQKVGYVVASVGELGGNVPYTTYNARKSYIEENEDVIEGYTKAINKALEYTRTHEASDIAEKILTFFPDNTLNDVTKVVERYKTIDAWFDNTYISEEDFNHVQEIVKNAGELDKNAPYEKLVNNKFSK